MIAVQLLLTTWFWKFNIILNQKIFMKYPHLRYGGGNNHYNNIMFCLTINY